MDIASKFADVDLARAPEWPTINATTQALIRRTIIDVVKVPFDSSDQDVKGYAAGAELDWTLIDFGHTRSKIVSAKCAAVAALANRDSAIQVVTLDAAQAFYKVLDGQSEVAADEQSERNASQNLEAAHARFTSGLAAMTDQLQAATASGNARLKRLRAEEALREAQIQLAVMIGADANAVIVAEETSDTVDGDLLPSADTLMETAKSNNPDISAARATADGAYADLKAAATDGYPTVTLVGSLRDEVHRSMYANFPFSAVTLPPNNSNRDKTVMLKLSVPLFDGFARQAKVHEARAAVREAADSLADTERQVALKVWKAYYSAKASSVETAQTEELVSNAQSAYRATKARYDAGAGTFSDLLNTQTALAAALSQIISSRSSERLARLQLAASLGLLTR